MRPGGAAKISRPAYAHMATPNRMIMDEIGESADEAYDQGSAAAARVGVGTRFRVSSCFLPTKYNRRDIEAEAIDGGAMTIGHPDLARAVIERS